MSEVGPKADLRARKSDFRLTPETPRSSRHLIYTQGFAIWTFVQSQQWIKARYFLNLKWGSAEI